MELHVKKKLRGRHILPTIQIGVERKPVSIHEELLGDQDDGLNIMRSHGRIDICYHSRRGMFVLANENINGPLSRQKPAGREAWKYIDHSGMMSYVNVDADRFQQIILDLVNG